MDPPLIYVHELFELYNNSSPDIDLEDPAVKAAATKIQSVFKGFKARRKVLSQTGYKCG